MLVTDYILDQPKVARDMLTSLPASYVDLLPDEPPKALLLVGTGSSMNALQTAMPLFRKLGVPTVLVSPQECSASLSELPCDGALAIVVSQSGESIDTLHASEALLAKGVSVIVLTGNPDSPISKVGAGVATMPVADEQIGPKTKGYSATALALQIIGHHLINEDLPITTTRSLEELDAFLPQAEAWAKKFSALAAEADVLVILGQKEHMGTASEGSLKIAEMSGLPSFGLETEEMSHGRFHGLTDRSLVCFITATDDEYEFAARMKSALLNFSIRSEVFDLRPHSISNDETGLRWSGSTLNSVLAPIIAIAPLQFLAVHTAVARGIDPEKMRYPSMRNYLGIKVGTAA